ncbi:ABC transporter permease [Virgisporangium aliadipatigenens]|uniref:ABC transporter permease n=1 Tax=Virgisporangium aliadipatigenens TaxID=741659 RepID=A0A8J3YPG7_9ACTN|nr:ABC transporter permease [Virgisporangium aliadipatigenens]GIJ48082.1 ABC transporter permease [Virgisporangium aliadipatigenens]
MRAVLILAGKDLRLRLRDRSAVLIAVVIPFTLALIFATVFGGNETPRPFAYAVTDLDRGPVAAAFVDVLDRLAERDIVTVRRVADPAEAAELADGGTIDAAFVLPAGIGTDGTAAIEVIGNVNAPTAADVARSLAAAFVDDLTSVRVAAVAAAGEPHDPRRIAALAERAARFTPPVSVVDVSAQRRILDTRTWFAAAMAVFFLFFTVQFGVSSLIEERAGGTLGRLLAMPVPPGAVLTAKLLTSVLFGASSLAVLIVATTAFMGASWGAPLAVAALAGAAVLAATGVTAVVASLARTAEQAGSWQAVLAMLLGMLGGVFFPIERVPALKALSWATPHGWFLGGLGELAGGGSLREVLPAVAAMCGFAAVTGAVAVVRLRKAVRP